MKKERSVVNNKKGMELEILGWLLLGLAVLVLIIVGFLILKGKGTSSIDYIQNLFRIRS